MGNCPAVTTRVNSLLRLTLMDFEWYLGGKLEILKFSNPPFLLLVKRNEKLH